MKKSLKVGIAPREIIAQHTSDVVAGRFAKVMSNEYRDVGA